jgi:hypothetical protein
MKSCFPFSDSSLAKYFVTLHPKHYPTLLFPFLLDLTPRFYRYYKKPTPGLSSIEGLVIPGNVPLCSSLSVLLFCGNRILYFDVITTVSASEKVLLTVNEVIPVQYHMFLFSFKFFVKSAHSSNISSSHSQNIMLLPSFRLSGSSCDVVSNWSFSSSRSYACDEKISFQILLEKGEELIYQFQARKNILTMQYYPPDASRGITLLPALIKFTSLRNTGEGETVTLVSKSFLLIRSIPDLSMPYNVIALVSCQCTMLYFYRLFLLCRCSPL